MFRFFPEYKFRRSTWYKFVRDQVAKNVGRIQYNSPVVEIDYSNKQVQLTTANGECFVADKVIMTTSVGVLRSGDIKFVPALPECKKAGSPQGCPVLAWFQAPAQILRNILS